MKNIFFLLFIFFTLIGSSFISSCCCKKKTTSQTSPEQKINLPAGQGGLEQEGYTKATVINYELDGCTFVLQLEDGKKLEPFNLAVNFKKDKLAVWIKYTLKKNTVSVCMVGQIVELTDIQLRK